MQVPTRRSTCWRRKLPRAGKVVTIGCIVVYFCWYASTIAQLVPSVGSHGTRGVAKQLRHAVASILGAHVRDDETWWLRPELYRSASGCDFSAAVAGFKPDELELNCSNMDEVETGEFVGKGFWREVFKTKWNGREVAIKRVKEKLLTRSDIIPRHVEECASIFSIRKEPNIVGLIGWCKSTVVVEYIPHRLDTLLFESNEPISVYRALELARDAARGVAQLHNAPGGPFVHADLQARQFLIDANGTLKLNDFNRVKYAGPRLVNGVPTIEKCTFETSVAKGKWRSPEEFQHLQLDEKLDIYSLSLVLWTLRARVKPFEMLTRDEVYTKVPAGLRPSLKDMDEYPQRMKDLIVKGWDNDPQKRPAAKDMADEIERILSSYEGAR
ncbi:hypothetical protein PsorP6_017975 [Peronosclerospora sorghi]|uniref:Uncharacterized protein n=1 Tax=Peronosclerospora sorghi TaxID=230839 RepID=A0ACC0WC55_9STRA|nr:hypothetical protein PsorP6_017975 [Peronosclerospora sorghi]